MKKEVAAPYIDSSEKLSISSTSNISQEAVEQDNDITRTDLTDILPQINQWGSKVSLISKPLLL